MSWIKMIDESEATGDLKEIYEDIIKKRGKLSNIMKIHSLNPASMKYHMDLYVHLMFGRSPLSRAEREMIGVIVSAANQCSYCIKHHAEALLFYWKDQDKVEKLIRDPQEIKLSERERAIIDYAHELTVHPTGMKQERIDRMKELGFDDREILDINLITSYFNFVNRIVMGLGVTFTEEEIVGYKY